MPVGAKKHKKENTYNSGCSPVVTHLATLPPVHRLTSRERTGSSGLENVLWSYVLDILGSSDMNQVLRFVVLAWDI